MRTDFRQNLGLYIHSDPFDLYYYKLVIFSDPLTFRRKVLKKYYTSDHLKTSTKT